MPDERFLTDAYRRFLDELRRTERRIVASAQPAAEVESPDPREVRGRLDHCLDEIQAAAVSAHRDTTAEDFVLAMSVMASTADTVLGRMVGWDGAAHFRDPSKDRLAVEYPIPEGWPTDLIDQILNGLGRAADEAGSVTESRGHDQVSRGQMSSDLARLYLLRLWVVPPTDADDSGERSLASVRARLSAQLASTTAPDADRRIFPAAYRRKAAPQNDALLPAVQPWVIAATAIGLIILILGGLVWLDTTISARDQVQKILDLPAVGATPSEAPPTSGASPGAGS